MGILASLVTFLSGRGQRRPDEPIPPCDTPGEGCDFRRVRWGMTLEEVQGTEPAEALARDANHLIYRSSFAGKAMSLAYKFTDQRLTSAYYAETDRSKLDEWRLQDCEEILETLTRRYGQPFQDRTAWRDEEAKGDLVSGDMYRYATWDLGRTRIGIDLYGQDRQIRCRISFFSSELYPGFKVGPHHTAHEKHTTPEERVASVRGDLQRAVAELAQVQPRLGDLEDPEPLESILAGLPDDGRPVGSRSTLRNLLLAEIAFVHLNSNSGSPETALANLETLRENDEALKEHVQIDDSTALIKSQLLQALYHLRQGDPKGTLVSIAAFDTTAAPFQVPGDRELVAQVTAAADESQRSAAMYTLRQKLLEIFQNDLEFMEQSAGRVEGNLLELFGGKAKPE